MRRSFFTLLTLAARRFSGASAVALDAAHSALFVADSRNGAVRRVALVDGSVTTLAGGRNSSASSYGSANSAYDGIGANATLRWPMGLAMLPDGQLLVSESGGHRLRAVDTSTGRVTSLAGGQRGTVGFVDGASIGALFYSPTALVSASAPVATALGLTPVEDGRLVAFLTDSLNHALRRISTAPPALFTLDVVAVGTSDPYSCATDGADAATCSVYAGQGYPFGAYSVLDLPGGLGSDVADELRFGGEAHSVSWCGYAGGGGGTLVLRGALQASLSVGGGAPFPVLNWTGLHATDVRVVPLALYAQAALAPSPGFCDASTGADDSQLALGTCAAAQALDAYAATLSAVCTAAFQDPQTCDTSGSCNAVVAAGYSLDGPALHAYSDEYSFGGGMYPGESHVVNVTLRRGARYTLRSWGSVRVTLVGLSDGLTLFNGTGESVSRMHAPALGGCLDPNAANYHPTALRHDGSCVGAGMPLEVRVSGAAAVASPRQWFSFGVFSVGGGPPGDDAQSPVVPFRRFAAANATALLTPQLAPGLYHVEWYGPLQGTVSLFEAPALSASTGGTAWWDGSGHAAAAASPVVVFGGDGASDGAPLLPDPLFPWGVPFLPTTTALDPYGAPLAGGARRAYFSVPPRPSYHAFFTSAAGGVVGLPTPRVTAAAWVPPTALGGVALSLQTAALLNLSSTAFPPLTLGRVVSAVYALLPLEDPPAPLAASLTVLLPYDVADAASLADGANLVVLGASNASGADWHVLPGASFANGLAAVALDARCVLAVALGSRVSALFPPFGSLRGGTRVRVAGSGLSHGRAAFCRFGAGAGPFSPALPPPPLQLQLLSPPPPPPQQQQQQGASAAVARLSAALVCVAPRMAPDAAAAWVTMQFFGADSLTSSPVDAADPDPPAFLFAGAPRVRSLYPDTASLGGGGLLRLVGERLAPPATQGGGETAWSDPWLCAFPASSAPRFSQAHVVSSALVLCEAPPGAQAGGGARVSLGGSPHADGAPFADAQPAPFAYARPPTAVAAAAAGSGFVSAPWGGDTLSLRVIFSSSSPAFAASASLLSQPQPRFLFRLGTVTLAARPGRAAGTLTAVAPACGAPGGALLRLALAGGAPGEPDTALAHGLAVVRHPAGVALYPAAGGAPGQRGSVPLTLLSDVASSDDAGDTSPPAVRCVLDGGASSLARALPGGGGGYTCALPTPPQAARPARFLSMALRLAGPGAGASPGAAVHVQLLAPPRLRAMHPPSAPDQGASLLWLTGAALRSPGALSACSFAQGRQSATVLRARAASSALMACEAAWAPAAPAGFVHAALVDQASGDALSSGDGASSQSLPRPRAPTLNAVSPQQGLPASGGALLSVDGARLSESPQLGCAFGTVDVAASWASSSALGCVHPARSPTAAAAPMQLRLALPGAWRSERAARLTVVAAPPQLWELPSDDAAAASLAFQDDSPAFTSSSGRGAGAEAGACLFGARAAAAARLTTASAVAAGGGAPLAVLACLAPPPPLGVSPSPRFEALSLTRLAPLAATQQLAAAGAGGPAGAALLGSAGGGGLQFERSAPPRLAGMWPQVAPVWGGSPLWLSGRGFQPGATACWFAASGTSPAAAAAATSAAWVVSSALLRCEAPPGGGATTVSLTSTAAAAASSAPAPQSAALALGRAQPSLAAAAAPAMGHFGGGTQVTVSGSGFGAAGPASACSFGTTWVAARVSNASSLACTAPAGAPGRLVRLGVAPRGWAGAETASQPSFLYY